MLEQAIKLDPNRRSNWLTPHADWQIRTFWYAQLSAVIVARVSIPLTLVVIGLGAWVVGMFALGLWAIYRITRGWLPLRDSKPLSA